MRFVVAQKQAEKAANDVCITIKENYNFIRSYKKRIPDSIKWCIQDKLRVFFNKKTSTLIFI